MIIPRLFAAILVCCLGVQACALPTTPRASTEPTDAPMEMSPRSRGSTMTNECGVQPLGDYASLKQNILQHLQDISTQTAEIYNSVALRDVDYVLGVYRGQFAHANQDGTGEEAIAESVAYFKCFAPLVGNATVAELLMDDSEMQLNYFPQLVRILDSLSVHKEIRELVQGKELNDCRLPARACSEFDFSSVDTDDDQQHTPREVMLGNVAKNLHSLAMDIYGLEIWTTI